MSDVSTMYCNICNLKGSRFQRGGGAKCVRCLREAEEEGVVEESRAGKSGSLYGLGLI